MIFRRGERRGRITEEIRCWVCNKFWIRFGCPSPVAEERDCRIKKKSFLSSANYSKSAKLYQEGKAMIDYILPPWRGRGANKKKNRQIYEKKNPYDLISINICRTEIQNIYHIAHNFWYLEEGRQEKFKNCVIAKSGLSFWNVSSSFL